MSSRGRNLKKRFRSGLQRTKHIRIFVVTCIRHLHMGNGNREDAGNKTRCGFWLCVLIYFIE